MINDHLPGTFRKYLAIKNPVYIAVKNSLIYPEISNGPMEGTNNKIKMLRRRGYGRAGIELINALAVLPWHYRDIDENCRPQNIRAA
jgi:hypothetical protein